MSTPSQTLCIGMINLFSQINSDITLNNAHYHLPSWLILWHNQHNIFSYLPTQLNPIGSLPKTLAKTLIPFLGAPQIFMHCNPGGVWIENCQSNPTQTLFVKGVLMTDPDGPSSSQKPNLALRLFTWYPNILFIVESFQKQDFKLQMPNKYDCHSHSQCQLFTTTTPPLYPAVFSLSSKQKLIQFPTFLWDREIPNGQSASNLWATSPPGSTFNSRNIITNKVISSFESISANTPLGGFLRDDMGLGKTIQAIGLIGTSKERKITNPHRSMPTSLNHQLAIRNIQACSGWSTASQHLP
ncbi:hypothetical protein O181_061330 [Austropuccinia psidii MF-1]|uniref:SNF2 N-terminal domain-containing protein n=1 Tax=Austropuccinia psidii MF-1 TaxID=1389203 RepID=A0A9Q3EM60_9BASI|nr:hypothetical protein [Austropuccinia psidii MF-1]